MQLFKRLIGDCKQNTVLTNSQILGILQRELHIEVAFLHELEVDIYLNLMKKYLKDWPQWDAFDKAINKLKSEKNYDAIRQMLNTKYVSLKEYLKMMLNKAAPIIEEVAGETISNSKNADTSEGDDDVVLEIHCTRRQLLEMFYRRPQRWSNIFNVTARPSRIVLNSMPLAAILNWWDTQIEINCGPLVYKRWTSHPLEHMLINKKLNKWNEDARELLPNVEMKSKPKNNGCFLSDIINIINRILAHYSSQPEYKSFLDKLFRQVLLDLEHLPEVFSPQSHFRKYMSKYPYIRYLYTNVDSIEGIEDNKYDLQLQEIVSPRYTLSIIKVNEADKTVPEFGDWVKISCWECMKVFQGSDIESSTVQHYSDFHQGEPDWQCTNCKIKLPMVKLAEDRWQHTCQENSDDK